MAPELQTSFQPLKQQLLSAAEAFSADAQSLHRILTGLVEDVERAAGEPLEIFPVCHHSPSSGLQMIRRLQAKQPRAIYMECCEDLRDGLEGLRDCKLPIALQAFAPQAEAFPAAWSPLNLVCPLTSFSAEFQAIAYCLEQPETELVFVDRSCDHVFQWMPQEDVAIADALPPEMTPDEMDSDAGMHGTAVGVEMGALQPTFEQFTQVLLSNARVQHFSEWWQQYVEEAIIGGDYAGYRQVMFLVGSLFRRLGTRDRDRTSNEQRERFMWTRIKQHLRQSDVDPADALYVCGAAHACSYVEEFGVASSHCWDIPPRTNTQWLYGLLPSSYSAIEYQFGHPRGAVSQAEARWQKALSHSRIKPFVLGGRDKASKAKAAKSLKALAGIAPSASVSISPAEHPLMSWLNKPPELLEQDEAELLHNCVKIVDLARRNGYMASTADSIAIYQTSILLANLRSRHQPTPYDFQDAAVTCLEKEAVPGKRSVSQLCNILLGGDQVGQIGYESMPPLARNVYDRLAKLPINLEARTIQRALLDLRQHPEYVACSDLLWKLRYLIGDVVRPIMGQRTLGHVAQQESWDVAIGKHQAAVLQLGYEGISVEHVLERRLKKVAFGTDARTIDALTAAEDCILYLGSERLTEELGDRCIELLVNEPDVRDAREIYSRITRLIHYYRSRPGGLPGWCQRFVRAGYSHYATLLPDAFANRGVAPGDLAGMMQFIFVLESLALSLGCSRNQLVIAIRQSQPETQDFTKQALHWAAECVLQLRDLTTLRSYFDELLDNELTVPAMPEYLSGFLLALSFTPQVNHLTVELMSKAFAKLPDRILMPWMPRLLMMLRQHADSALPGLIKEAVACFPSSLSQLGSWQAPWQTVESASLASGSVAVPISRAPRHPEVAALLASYPETTTALATCLGVDAGWNLSSSADDLESPATQMPCTAVKAVTEMLRSHPATLDSLASLLASRA